MGEAIAEFLNQYLPDELVIFLISMLPVIELRGGLLVSSFIFKMPWIKALVICVLGSCVPVPFILLFIKRIFAWLKKTKLFSKLVHKFEKKAIAKSKEAENKRIIGKMIFIFFFVAIPLPGTGAWTGSLIAAFMDIRIKYAVLAIVLGVISSGLIMVLLSYAFPSLLGFSFA